VGLGVGAALGVMIPGLVQQAGRANPAAAAYCVSCGAGLPAGANFCPGCGTKKAP
jgi:hypothetical protein